MAVHSHACLNYMSEKMDSQARRDVDIIRAAPICVGMFSNRLMVRCEHNGAPLSGNRPAVSLNSGSMRSASQSSASSRPQAMAMMRNSSISSTAWLIRLESAPVLNAGRQHARQAEPPVRLPQEHQAAIRGNCTAIEVREHRLAGNGWKIEVTKAIVAHGGCRSC